MTPELIAQVAHEINRAYCASQGDTSQAAWLDAPDWQKQSARAGVAMHLANPDATPEQSHESWLTQKTAEGWAYGNVKDADKKLHPCFLPYAELPAAQKAKDYLFRGVVHALKSLASTAMVVSAPTAITAGKPAANSGAVTYIGRENPFIERNYGSGLSFEPGQSRTVPDELAAKLLRHGDVFSTGKRESVPVEPVGDGTRQALMLADVHQAERVALENQRQDVVDQVNLMDKDALKGFAHIKYGQPLPKTLSIENMRSKVVGLIDQYGLV